MVYRCHRGAWLQSPPVAAKCPILPKSARKISGDRRHRLDSHPVEVVTDDLVLLATSRLTYEAATMSDEAALDGASGSESSLSRGVSQPCCARLACLLSQRCALYSQLPGSAFGPFRCGRLPPHGSLTYASASKSNPAHILQKSPPSRPAVRSHTNPSPGCVPSRRPHVAPSEDVRPSTQRSSFSAWGSETLGSNDNGRLRETPVFNGEEDVRGRCDWVRGERTACSAVLAETAES